MQCIESEALSVHVTGRGGFDQDVGGVDECKESVAIARDIDVEYDTSFAETKGAPEERLLRVIPRALRSRILLGGRRGEGRREARFAAARRLDL